MAFGEPVSIRLTVAQDLIVPVFAIWIFMAPKRLGPDGITTTRPGIF